MSQPVIPTPQSLLSDPNTKPYNSAHLHMRWRKVIIAFLPTLSRRKKQYNNSPNGFRFKFLRTESCEASTITESRENKAIVFCSAYITAHKIYRKLSTVGNSCGKFQWAWNEQQSTKSLDTKGLMSHYNLLSAAYIACTARVVAENIQNRLQYKVAYSYECWKCSWLYIMSESTTLQGSYSYECWKCI